MSEDPPPATADATPDLRAALTVLRDDLRGWPEALDAALAALPLLKKYEVYDSQPKIADRDWWLTVHREPVERGRKAIQDYDALIERIGRNARPVARAAEKAGLDSSPLSLFAEEAARIGRPDDRRWEEARAVVERLAAREPEAAKRKTGRPRKGETDKERVVISALDIHHKRQGLSVGDDTPAKVRALARLASDKHVQVSVGTVSRFFKKKFPDRGYKGYETACIHGRIGALLARWQGEDAERHADLLPHDSGRGEND
jgi:hypothetical protein